MRRKLTAEEAKTLNLEPFVDYYEFGDDGVCVSLRNGETIGNANGTVSLSGKIETTTVRLIKIIALMYLGLAPAKGVRLYNMNGVLTDCAAANIGTEPMSEYIARFAAERRVSKPDKTETPRKDTPDEIANMNRKRKWTRISSRQRNRLSEKMRKEQQLTIWNATNADTAAYGTT